MTARAYAERRGLTLGTLNHWVYALGRGRSVDGVIPRESAFVEVLAATGDAGAAAAAVIEIELANGTRIRLPMTVLDAHAREAAALISALGKR